MSNNTYDLDDHLRIDIVEGIIISMSIPVGFFILYTLYQLILLYKNQKNNIKIVRHYCCKKSNCPICLENFSVLVKYKCDHTFCKECSNSWRQVSHTCPLCRADI